MCLKQLRKHQNAGDHPNRPACAEAQQRAQALPPRRGLPAKQTVQRAQQIIIKAQNERDRPAGHAGDAVSQRHAQAVKCRKQAGTSQSPPHPEPKPLAAVFYSVYHLPQKKYSAAAPVEAALHRLVQGEYARIS